MNSHTGLSLTPERICFASFQSETDPLVLDRVGQIPYLSPYVAGTFFEEKNITPLVDLLNSTLSDQGIDVKTFSVSLESNLALLKRVAFPLQLDKSGRQDHIKWDLAQNLNLSISDYIYYQSGNIHRFKNIEEELVIALPKKIITFIKKLAAGLSSELVSLSIHQLSAEFLLKSVLGSEPEKLVIVQKISADRVETGFYLDGNYFSSHYTPIASLKEFSVYIDLLKSKTQYIENLLLQYGENEIHTDRVLVYGDPVNEEFIKRIQKNMSVPVDRLHAVQNLALSDTMKNAALSDNDQMKYAECIGIALDI